MAKIDGGTKDIGSRNLDEVDLVRVIGLAEECFGGNDDVDGDAVGEASVDAGGAAGLEETLMRYEWLLRSGGRTCTYRSVLENISGTEMESGMEDFEEEGADDVSLRKGGAGLDEDAGDDLAEDELRVAEIGLGLRRGFGVELVFGRWEVMDGQVWSLGKRC